MPSREIDPHFAKLVSVYRHVSEIVLHSFHVDFESLSATFNARFDGKECGESFTIEPSHDGGYRLVLPTMPWHHTEIISLVRMPAVAEAAISAAIQSLFPPIRPLGWDWETEREILLGTPVKQRLRHPEDFDAFVQALSAPEFSLTVRPDPDPQDPPKKAGGKRRKASRNRPPSET